MFINGSKWLRMDCHLHTYGGNYGLTNMKFNGENFEQEFIDKMVKENINIGFITNHNEFLLKQYKKLNRIANKKNIYLLPGVELNIKEGYNGVHTLIIFDEESWITNKENKNYIEEFLTESFSGQQSRNERTNLDLNGTLALLERYNKNYFIIFAHVNQDSGFIKEIDNGLMKTLAKNPLFKKRVVGFQKIRCVKEQNGELKTNNIKQLEINLGKGNKKAYLEGSDPKKIEDIGNGEETYIKIGEYNFKSIEYALNNCERRIVTERAIREGLRLTDGEIKTKIHNKKAKKEYKDKEDKEIHELVELNHNKYSNKQLEKLKRTNEKRVYVKSIEYLGGRLDKVKLNLSSELNTIIGIRGSGKSGIVETLRYCIYKELDEEENTDIEYKEELIEYILGSGGKIICEVIDDENTYKISRTYGEEPRIEEKLIDDSYKDINIDRKAIIKNPLYFGQKDLTTNKEGYETKLLEKLIGNKLDKVNSNFKSKNMEILEEVKQFYNIQKKNEERDELLKNNRNLEHSQEKYEQYKLKERLEEERKLKLDYEEFKTIRKKIEVIFKELNSILKTFDNINVENILKDDYNKKSLDELFKGTKIIIKDIKENQNLFSENLKKYEEIEEKMDNNIKDKEEIFAKIKREISEELAQENIMDINADMVIKIEKELRTNTKKIDEISQEIERKDEILREIEKKIEEKDKILKEKQQIYIKSIDRINKSEELEVSLIDDGDINLFKQDLIEQFKGSHLREETVFRPISENFKNIYEVFKDIYLKESKHLSTVIEDDKNRIKFVEFLEKNYTSILNIEKREKVEIKYHDKNINQHSVGQKASAIILFTLTQNDNEIIIIDQPEDDLDNKVIYDELVESILDKKPNTQFIFSTHNANIPVLGDSDQILVAEFKDTSLNNKIIVKDGSIDKLERQEDIIEIMEGGVKAFERRNDVYKMWK